MNATRTLPTVEQRAEAVEESFEKVMKLVRDHISDEARDEVIKAWAHANFHSRAIGWEEGWTASA